MGVPGLWDILNNAGRSVSLSHLAVVIGFEQDASRKRGYRLGIDVYLWFHHTISSKAGDHPELRLLFFRLVELAKLPIIPLFVFDGRNRPAVKRGSRLGKSGSHALAKDFKKFLDAFGMEWREAPGEAEAELAYLNQEGVIDAVLTDDCDTFLFGAHTIIKNKGGNLSGNVNNPALNQQGKSDKNHYQIYYARDFQSNAQVKMTQGGMILFALLAGGDYDKGVPGFGKKTAHGLAKCGFGDELLNRYRTRHGHDFDAFLRSWRARVNLEVSSNSQGHLPQRNSAMLPEDFPKRDVLEKYIDPICSNTRNTASITLRDNLNLDIAEIGRLCEEYFSEWGYKAKLLYRFRTLIWPCAVIHVLRKAALEADRRGNVEAVSNPVGTPARIVQAVLGSNKKAGSKRGTDRTEQYAAAFARQDGPSQPQVMRDVPDDHPLILGLAKAGKRQHSSTDEILEYRVKVSPVQLVRIVEAGLKGLHSAPSQTSERAAEEPESPLLLWLPAAMVDRVHPGLGTSSLSKRQHQSTPSTSSATPTPRRNLYPESFPDQARPTGGPSNRSKNRFLFSFADPDAVSFSDTEDSIEIVDDRSADDNSLDWEEDPTLPKTRFDLICDRILDGPLNKPKKKTGQKRARGAASTSVRTVEPPPKRQRTASSLLDALDSIADWDFS